MNEEESFRPIDYGPVSLDPGEEILERCRTCASCKKIRENDRSLILLKRSDGIHFIGLCSKCTIRIQDPAFALCFVCDEPTGCSVSSFITKRNNGDTLRIVFCSLACMYTMGSFRSVQDMIT